MDKNLYIIAELDDDTQKIIENYEKIIFENGFIGNQTKDIPYHITLGRYSLEYENYLKDLLDNVGKKFKEINISYSGFGLFKLDVLYLNPCMSIKLMELYNFIKEKSYYQDNDFAAHTTIYMDEPENIIKLLPKMVENSNKINGKIKYISLYEFFPKKLLKKIELKKE
jgi:2'-5' RNA ligase